MDYQQNTPMNNGQNYPNEPNNPKAIAALVLGIVLGALFLSFCIAAVVQSGLKGNQLPHGYFSKTKDVSTLNASRRKKAGKAANISSDLPKEN